MRMMNEKRTVRGRFCPHCKQFHKIFHKNWLFGDLDVYLTNTVFQTFHYNGHLGNLLAVYLGEVKASKIFSDLKVGYA